MQDRSFTRVMRLGFAGAELVVKPFTQARLGEKIRQVLDREESSDRR
jgi:hypothetical protein